MSTNKLENLSNKNKTMSANVITLSQVEPSIIDDFLNEYPIRGILCKKSIKDKEVQKCLTFHLSNDEGWVSFDVNLKSNNQNVEIKSTPNGFVYFILNDNSIAFFKVNKKRQILNYSSITMTLESLRDIPSHLSFFRNKGVVYHQRKFVIPYKNGEMRIGNWKDIYF